MNSDNSKESKIDKLSESWGFHAKTDDQLGMSIQRWSRFNYSLIVPCLLADVAFAGAVEVARSAFLQGLPGIQTAIDSLPKDKQAESNDNAMGILNRVADEIMGDLTKAIVIGLILALAFVVGSFILFVAEHESVMRKTNPS